MEAPWISVVENFEILFFFRRITYRVDCVVRTLKLTLNDDNSHVVATLETMLLVSSPIFSKLTD